MRTRQTIQKGQYVLTSCCSLIILQFLCTMTSRLIPWILPSKFSVYFQNTYYPISVKFIFWSLISTNWPPLLFMIMTKNYYRMLKERRFCDGCTQFDSKKIAWVLIHFGSQYYVCLPVTISKPECKVFFWSLYCDCIHIWTLSSVQYFHILWMLKYFFFPLNFLSLMSHP